MKGLNVKSFYYLLFTEKQNERGQNPYWHVSYHSHTDSITVAERTVEELLKSADIARVTVWMFRERGELRQVGVWEKKYRGMVNLLHCDGFHALYGSALLDAMADLHKTITASAVTVSGKDNEQVATEPAVSER